jgi:trigger factor
MQVNETLSEGLKHEFQILVPVADLDAKVDAKLHDLKDKVRLNGFRPGKVPVAHLKKVYGKSVMAETIDETVKDTNNKIFTDHGFKLAGEPTITLPTEKDAVDALLNGKSDLSYTVAFEVIPPIKLADFKSFSVTKPVVEVADADVDEAINRIVEQNRPFADKGVGAKAEKGDRVTISFKGTINGEAFEGGTSENIPVVIGSNTFIPGFEDQLSGIAAGDNRIIKLPFPTNYANDKLAGKDAEFDTTAMLVEAPQAIAADDEFAKKLGIESLDKLKDAARQRIRQEYDSATRQRVKRQLLDQLDKAHEFGPPQSLVDQEFELMWQSITNEMASTNRTFADENTTEEKAKEDYRKIADRRVRLGLVLSEIGEKNNITVTDDEVGKAMVERARQFPGQEKQVWDYYRNNPGAMAQLRAPIFEDKVVDFVLELAKVTENKVTREELAKEEPEDASA